MDDFSNKHLTENEEKDILKNAITTIVENYKAILISNNRISAEDKQKYYNDLDHNVTLIEFITKCNLDKDVLWNGLERKDK
jgi:hypothetical protein